jgi:hypothetical protein
MSSTESLTSSVEDCAFCTLPVHPQSAYDESWRLNEDAYLVPALGMLMAGNILAVTDRHYTSFGQLGRARLAEVNQRLEAVLDRLGEHFGPYFRTEHGSDNLAAGPGGCMAHAHQHGFPDVASGAAIFQRLPWQRLGKYEDLADFHGRPYVYLGYLGCHYVVADPPRLPSQWTRRQVAQSLAQRDPSRDPDNWDWLTYNGDRHLAETLPVLRSELSELPPA